MSQPTSHEQAATLASGSMPSHLSELAVVLPHVDTLLLMTEHCLLHKIAKGVRAVIAAGVTVNVAAARGDTLIAVRVTATIATDVIRIVVAIGKTPKPSLRAMLWCLLL